MNAHHRWSTLTLRTIVTATSHLARGRLVSSGQIGLARSEWSSWWWENPRLARVASSRQLLGSFSQWVSDTGHRVGWHHCCQECTQKSGTGV
ncbi:hypothetical protein L210DRAFT_3088953 [Boletus edulis BED1]|uniref:Uncharacterized protein n=1 Tax=Boletus edulis BED1 TaxID=1328754 RepID=A0AAD4BZQ7_BOLED|nr:hypothetical protein L210DRAFT_3088953 [Boletus edulis BED1]